jgi:hypothetical protein
MNMQLMKFSQVKDSKSVRTARGHIIGRLEEENAVKINSVFLRTRSLGSRINWQAELLKLEDAS